MPELQLTADQHVFGPVPSRRLGSSLGINNIPPKICTYACVYCQLGNLSGMSIQRKRFFDPVDLAGEVENKIQGLTGKGERPDYLTIVPDGEPTLDLNLGRLIELLKPLGIKIAVISNASMVHIPAVRENLARADWVSLKVDSVQEHAWEKINRPHGRLRLEKILEGILSFQAGYKGILATETMLIRDLNDGKDLLRENARFLSQIHPSTAYLAVPTRPPAEKWVNPPTVQALTRAYQIYQEEGLTAELLIGYEGNKFSSTGDFETDLLSITAVHPLREDAVGILLEKTGSPPSLLEKMIAEEKVGVSEYQGRRYYLRKFSRN